MPGDASCPDPDALEAALWEGGLSEADAAHVASCPDCRAVVEAIRANNDLLRELAGSAPEAPARPPTIEGYDVLDEIHRGAQGVVWRAVQRATNRVVAVKVLAEGALATARQRRRFERELELVATLRHRNVVTVHDGGRTADGGFFLVMEYVDGVTLDRRDDPPPADRAAVRGTVRRFAGIAAAVAAAHQRGIIHRDLKPANIIIDAEGAPRVLDFGLAKDAGEEDELVRTVAGEFLGTFAYAAPEQVGGDPAAIDVRCDVYALGMILHELLTGARPYRVAGSMAEVVRTILETRPAPPSRSNPAVDDDLDTIVAHCLEKDRDRRYDGAAALLEDLRHYLAGEPINAKRDRPWYLVRKAMQRHRVPLLAAAGLVVLVFAFAVSMAVLAERESRARALADAEATRARTRLAAFVDLLASETLRTRVDEETLPALFDEADRIVTDELAAQPDAAAAVRRKLGEAQIDRGEYGFALRQFELALDAERERRPPSVADEAETLHQCGRALWFLGRFDEAEARYRAALEGRLRVLDPGDPEVLLTRSHLAATRRKLGRLDEAEADYREVLEQRRRVLPPDDPMLAASHNNLGVCLRDEARYGPALEQFETTLRLMDAAGLDNPIARATTLHNIARCLLPLGRADEAAGRLEASLVLKRGELEDAHPSVATGELWLAKARLAQGRAAEARTLAETALAKLEAAYPGGHEDVDLARALLRELDDLTTARRSPSAG